MFCRGVAEPHTHCYAIILIDSFVVALTPIAFLAQSLQITQLGFASFRIRLNMIYMQLCSTICCRTFATEYTTKIVAL